MVHISDQVTHRMGAGSNRGCIPHLLALMHSHTPLYCRTGVDLSLHSPSTISREHSTTGFNMEMKDKLSTLSPRQAVCNTGSRMANSRDRGAKGREHGTLCAAERIDAQRAPHKPLLCWRQQECIGRRNPACLSFLFSPDGLILLLILQGLAFSSLSAAAAHGNFRKEEVDIDLHEGILTRTFENPVISLNSVWRMALSC